MNYPNMSNEELEKLVNQKDGEAICELGERCLYGTKGHEKNLTRAYQLFHKGEKLGMQRAYLGLAQMYEQGIYLAQNSNLANQYYQKAGTKPAAHEPVQPTGGVPVNQPTSRTSAAPVYRPVTQQSGNVYTQTSRNVINTMDIQNKINKAEQLRQQDDFYSVKQECEEALKMIQKIESGMAACEGSGDLDELSAEAYWVLAFTAFNEQKTGEMENYLAKDGVIALHPWGAYLRAVLHRNMQAPGNVLEQDLQTLTMVSQNQNLTMMEKGDVLMMIADLIMDGYGKGAGYTKKMAQKYYEESAQCGNAYAYEQAHG